MTCTRPGTGANQCGAGVAAGTKLSDRVRLRLGDPGADQQMQQYKSDAAKAGIELNMKQEPFNSVIGEAVPCTSDQAVVRLADRELGRRLDLRPDYLPTGESLFATGAGSNSGSYSDPKMDQLIEAIPARERHRTAVQVRGLRGQAAAGDLPGRTPTPSRPSRPTSAGSSSTRSARCCPSTGTAPSDPLPPRRVAQAVVVMLLVSLIVFVLLHLLPGGAARGSPRPAGDAGPAGAVQPRERARQAPVAAVPHLARASWSTATSATATGSTRASPR